MERALSLLTVISGAGGGGAPLGVIADRSGLDAATTRRLLLALMRAGFVSQEATGRQYYLGLAFFTIAAAAANRFDHASARRPILRELARRARGDAAFFLREGDEMVCLDAVRGAVSLDGPEMGARRPIGAEAFGIALLAALPDDEGESIVIRNVRRYARQPEAAIREVGQRLREARRIGHAATLESFTGVASLAVAVLDRDGRAEGAIGICRRGLDPARAAGLARDVAAAADALHAELWRRPQAASVAGPARLRLPADAGGFTL